MSDSLRTLLTNTDLSAPSIQGAAKAMLRQYDKSALMAVTEWRNALHEARADQYLPLLYVANEVLQQSKRNRGNKFLEAFTPTLGQSLAFMCEHSTPDMVEKIRRTVKIWADRRIFSVRYVNELIQGLEMYRNGGRNKPAPQPSASASSSPADSTSASLSSKASSSTVPAGHLSAKGNDKGKSGGTDEDDNDVEMSPTGSDSLFDDDNDSDGADDLFGNTSSKLLKIDVDLEQKVSKTKQQESGKGSDRKRRRSSIDSATNSSGGVGRKSPGHASKRKSTLSTNSLSELYNTVESLQSSYDYILSSMKEIENADETAPTAIGTPIEELVGDELLLEYKKVLKLERRLTTNQREMHQIANSRHDLEKEAIRYLPWLEQKVKQDQDDAKFCDTYRNQLLTFQHIQAKAREARDKRVMEEAKKRQEEEMERKRKQDEEDQRKFMEAALAKQTEAEPGMVWDKARQEYVHKNTDESWRD